MGVRKKICAYKNFIFLWRNVSLIFTKEIFEQISNEYKFEIEDTVARYLKYAVMIYFPGTGNLSVWLGSDIGFVDADNYTDAVEKIEKCLAYIARAEFEYKKELGKERLRKMEGDFV